MTPMVMTPKTMDIKFYAVVKKEEKVVYTELGIIDFPNDEQLESFMIYNQAKETPLDPENFKFFKL